MPTHGYQSRFHVRIGEATYQNGSAVPRTVHQGVQKFRDSGQCAKVWHSSGPEWRAGQICQPFAPGVQSYRMRPLCMDMAVFRAGLFRRWSSSLSYASCESPVKLRVQCGLTGTATKNCLAMEASVRPSLLAGEKDRAHSVTPSLQARRLRKCRERRLFRRRPRTGTFTASYRLRHKGEGSCNESSAAS